MEPNTEDIIEESKADNVELIFVPKQECITIEPCERLDSITIFFSSGISLKLNSSIVLLINFNDPFFTLLRNAPTFFAVL